LDKFATIYLWLLLVVCALTAIVRLGATRISATIMAEKLANLRYRRRQKYLGWIVLIASPLILVYGFFGPIRLWMWVAVLVGILSGGEQTANTAAPEVSSLVWQSRIFGLLNAAAAICIWVAMHRAPVH
jgi:hypothetical protein